MAMMPGKVGATGAGGAGGGARPGGWFRKGWVLRLVLTVVAVGFLGVFIVVPAVNVFAQALGDGWGAYKAVFFPPAVDEGRVAELNKKVEAFDAELAKLPTRERLRAQRERAPERRAWMDEVSALQGPAERSKKNWSAVRMTLGVAAVVVPLNILFGLAAAWAVTKFRFKGKTLLVSLIDLPFSVSPVIAGLIFVLLFGGQGFLGVWAKSDRAVWLAPAVKGVIWGAGVWLGVMVLWWLVRVVVRVVKGRATDDPQALSRKRRWVGWAAFGGAMVFGVAWAYAFDGARSWAYLDPTDWRWPDPTSLYWRGFSAEHWWPVGAGEWQWGVIFTPLAIALASIFVTFPFVARSLIPLMESQGVEAEQAAITLGAGGWYTFRRVTLPSIKWGLLYGAILCTARALGEFGAVSVVSGHRDSLLTMPLRVEQLWQGGGRGLGTGTQAAFTVASWLACLALVTLVVKAVIEWKTARNKDEG